MTPIPNSAQMELFPELPPTLTPEEEQELQQMIKTSRLNKGVNGTSADDMQVSGNHYKDMPIQPWHIMEAVLTPEEFEGFLKGNIIKYSLRAGRKDITCDRLRYWLRPYNICITDPELIRTPKWL